MEQNNQTQTTPLLKRIANIEQSIKELKRQIDMLKRVIKK